ncbi:hypothetical protein OG698_21055 [Streptomyces sp. NBC_01003]|uniref:hypothetical protein n=1 Tax=Streptomyces sp. NBC_01003 TaxID=2903714 RepID=UPI00386E78D6|nr:hypothetical protein OG698_21055 [Streptomyces sp. NBC_01003]
MTTEPVSRTILLFDIERFSDRDDVEQACLRRMLYAIADRTLEAAGIDETLRMRADRGDSVMELIEACASVTGLLRALLTEVPAQLRAVNRMASRSAQIRLRGVVATGFVAVDPLDGWSAPTSTTPAGSSTHRCCGTRWASVRTTSPCVSRRACTAGSSATTIRASRATRFTPSRPAARTARCGRGCTVRYRRGAARATTAT